MKSHKRFIPQTEIQMDILLTYLKWMYAIAFKRYKYY